MCSVQGLILGLVETAVGLARASLGSTPRWKSCPGLSHVSVILLGLAGQAGHVSLTSGTEAQEGRPRHLSTLQTGTCHVLKHSIPDSKADHATRPVSGDREAYPVQPRRARWVNIEPVRTHPITREVRPGRRKARASCRVEGNRGPLGRPARRE